MDSDPVFYCVRVYEDLSAKHTRRDRAGLESWLSYNRTFRPGCALFVDGSLAGKDDKGSLTDDEALAIEVAITAEIKVGKPRRLSVEKVGPQVEAFAGRHETYTGYPAEIDRDPFDLTVGCLALSA